MRRKSRPAVFGGVILLLVLLCACADPAPASAPPTPRPTAAPSAVPSPTPVPELPYKGMPETGVEKTLLGKAAEVISPCYPYQGKVNPTQTEYLFGEADFPTVFVFCQGGAVIHVEDHRGEARPETPYVGMPEEWIHCTGLGELKETTHSAYFAAGELRVSRHYVLADRDYTYFYAGAVNGFVSEIRDYRSEPSEHIHFSRPSSMPDADYYDNPEDFWYDNMDEFEDYEEAAEYWQEEYGGDSVF